MILFQRHAFFSLTFFEISFLHHLFRVADIFFHQCLCFRLYFYISNYLLTSLVVYALLCECDEFCPDNHFNNYTCATDEGYCFAKLHFDDKNKTIVRTHGCTADTHDGGIFQCRHKKHEKPITMMCCKDADYCNSHLEPTLPPTTNPKFHPNGTNLFFFNCFAPPSHRVGNYQNSNL